MNNFLSTDTHQRAIKIFSSTFNFLSHPSFHTVYEQNLLNVWCYFFPSSADLKVLKLPMKSLLLFRVNRHRITWAVSQTLTWTGESTFVCKIYTSLELWFTWFCDLCVVMMSSLHTICQMIRRWVQPVHHATSETVWKVRLNRTELDLTF